MEIDPCRPKTMDSAMRQMMLHVEPVPSKYATKILAHRLQNNEKAGCQMSPCLNCQVVSFCCEDRQDALATASVEAALEGMVPWEAGNARYLMSAVGAKVGITLQYIAKTSLRRQNHNHTESEFGFLLGIG